MFLVDVHAMVQTSIGPIVVCMVLLVAFAGFILDDEDEAIE